MTFDPDALLSALPRRIISPVPTEIKVVTREKRIPPTTSAIFEPGSYNGFSARERDRTAQLSNWLAKIGSTERPAICDICAAPATDEHAENYYDLTSWIGLCRRCHRSALHGRFERASIWMALLDNMQVPQGHWARLVSPAPFDLAALQRARGTAEPTKIEFIP